MTQYRTETDSMGDVQVPATALYGAQTQRALNNFAISGLTLPGSFIYSVALIKKTAAQVNSELGLLDRAFADAIIQASESIMAGEHAEQFAVNVFQTNPGSI